MDGDCNIVKDLTIDRQGGNPNRQHQYELEQLNEINQNCSLIDIWRTQNKFKMQFTYENNLLDFKSRIDRIYLWKHAGKIFSTLSDILPNTLSEHHLTCLSLKNITINKTGPSYWKLNTSILENKAYKQKIESFCQHWQNMEKNYLNQTKSWDMAKRNYKV